MKAYNADQVRNIAVVGHGGSGKTSLLDAALYDTGAATRIGRVDDGTSASDYDPDEQKRRMSINLSVIPVEVRETKINFLDTPGYADFVGDVMSGLRVADSALFVISAEKGVEVGTELAWRRADEHELPRIAFVNRLDRENTTYERALDSLRAQFGTKVVPLSVPIGEQSALSGVVDLVSGKGYGVSGDKAVEMEIPAGMRDQIAKHREMLVESAVESDDDLMTKYLDGGEITEEELRKAVTAGVAAGSLVPVCAGSAARNIGIHTLLNALVDYTPSAMACPQTKADAAPAIFVFKTILDPQKGSFSYFFRVYQGKILPDAHLFNVVTATDERLGQIYTQRGKAQEVATELRAGDIGVVARLAKTHTGNTLGAKDMKPYDPIHFPAPLFVAAIHPKTQSDLDKMSTALARIQEEDPTLHVSRDLESAETLLAGMGESHVAIAAERMQRRFGVEVIIKDQRVPYRETIRKKARAEGRHKKQSGGHGQFGDVWLEVEPLPEAETFVFENKIVGGVVPREYVPGVEKGVAESLKEGFIAGYPMVHVHIALVDGKYHDVDSSSQSFEIAARLGMKEAMTLANPTLLEPIMTVTILAPETNMGDVSSDLNTKRARIMGMEPSPGGMQKITAQVPMAEMLHYATDLRSITQGRGTFSMAFSSYEEVPANVLQEIIEQHKKEHAHKA
jgi:elongation factor G